MNAQSIEFAEYQMSLYEKFVEKAEETEEILSYIDLAVDLMYDKQIIIDERLGTRIPKSSNVLCYFDVGTLHPYTKLGMKMLMYYHNFVDEELVDAIEDYVNLFGFVESTFAKYNL